MSDPAVVCRLSVARLGGWAGPGLSIRTSFHYPLINECCPQQRPHSFNMRHIIHNIARRAIQELRGDGDMIIPKLGVLLVMLGGCSLVAMRGVDPNWDGVQEPKCSEGYAPVYVDGFLASTVAGVAVELAQADVPTDEDNTIIPIVAATVLVSLIFTGSAATGVSRYRECRKAKAGLYVREALGDSQLKVDIEPTVPREGYFCTYSPSLPELHLCVREYAGCEHARAALAIPDGEACVSRKLAWCFDINGTSRCLGTQYACEERSAASVAGSRACTERP
jgi:hypothetical protein